MSQQPKINTDVEHLNLKKVGYKPSNEFLSKLYVVNTLWGIFYLKSAVHCTWGKTSVGIFFCATSK